LPFVKRLVLFSWKAGQRSGLSAETMDGGVTYTDADALTLLYFRRL